MPHPAFFAFRDQAQKTAEAVRSRPPVNQMPQIPAVLSVKGGAKSRRVCSWRETAALLVLAKLEGADLTDANLAGTDLMAASLRGADLTDANLPCANLHVADLGGANLRDSNLSEVKNWRNIRSIESANIYGIKNPPEGFLEWAKERGALSAESDYEWKELIREKMQ